MKEMRLDWWNSLIGTVGPILLLAFPSWVVWEAFKGNTDPIIYWVATVPCLLIAWIWNSVANEKGAKHKWVWKGLAIWGFVCALAFQPIIPLSLGRSVWRILDVMVLAYFGHLILFFVWYSLFPGEQGPQRRWTTDGEEK